MKQIDKKAKEDIGEKGLTKIAEAGAIGLIGAGISAWLGKECYQFFIQTPPEIYAGIASGILSGSFGIFSLQYLGMAAKLMKK